MRKFEFEPELENIIVECRLIIMRSKNEVEHRIPIKQGEKYILHESELQDKAFMYIYKYQTLQEGKWKSVSSEKPLVKIPDIGNFFSGKKVRTIKEAVEFIEMSNSSSISKNKLKNTFQNLTRDIWNQKEGVHENAQIFLEASRLVTDKTPFVKEMEFYIGTYLLIRNKFMEMNLLRKTYQHISALRRQENEEFLKVIKEILSYCEQHTNFQSSHVIMGKLLSLIGDRKSASESFSKARQFKNDFIEFFYMDLGLFTYTRELKRNVSVSKFNTIKQKIFGPKINFDEYKKITKTNFTILFSVDPKFLRLYGTYLFFAINFLKTYHFHFHVVGKKKETEEVVNESKLLFEAIKGFRSENNENIEYPTFSLEEIPYYVGSERTYYACARFVVAQEVMNYFNSDLYIMDADLAFDKDPALYFEKLRNYDVALPIVSGLRYLSPWRRFMAGNVFLKNNNAATEFINITKQYIIQNIGEPVSWMLDQNALSYAYDQIQNINIGNTGVEGRPTVQLPINYLIENNKK